MKLRPTQRAVWDNKVRKGFNTTDVPLELCLLQGEISELFEAWRCGSDHIGEELADVAIYLLGLAEMIKVDLEQEILRKLDINAKRRYVRHGETLLKAEPAAAAQRLRLVEPQTDETLF